MTRLRALGRTVVTLAVLAVLAGGAAGCSRGPSVRFVPDGGTQTLAEVERSAATVSLGSAASVRVEDAPRVREQALARLRENGGDAGKAADLMTREFPVVTKAVPLYVEAATVGSRPAWIIVEAWGDRTGMLKYRRLWVFDRQNSWVIDSKTYQ
jgi:hypothetical protein